MATAQRRSAARRLSTSAREELESNSSSIGAVDSSQAFSTAVPFRVRLVR